MTTMSVATSSADAQAVTAMEQHHAELQGALSARVSALTQAVEKGAGVDERRADLVAFIRAELLTHAAAEEEALYPAGRDNAETRMLVDAMIAEHRRLEQLADDVAAGQPLGGAPAAQALLVLFEEHLLKENDRLLPVLAQSPDVSLAGLLQGMHEALEAAPAAAASAPAAAADSAHGHSTCACGHEPDDATPELDVRVVPHAIRHATVFGALSAVPPGGSLILVADHAPMPLIAQIEQLHPGVFVPSFEAEGPEVWRLRFDRRG